jgi:uncharacterized membrane protein
MYISGISLIGWIHTIACIAALLFGGSNIVAGKGTRPHKCRGSAYAVAMVIAMGLSFFIYRFDIPLVRGEKTGPGVFGLFHWFAVSALFFTVLGYYAASRQSRGFWAYAHPIAMTLSYYVLIGGLINELFARLNILRPLAFTLVNGQLVFGSIVVGMTQFAAEIATLILLILFIVKVWRYRRNRSSATGVSAP